MKRVGFTGTRAGMTPRQKRALDGLLRRLGEPCDSEFHHGDCVGADEEAAHLAYLVGYAVAAHPPSDMKLRARRPFWACTYLEPRPYLQRNRDIVEACDCLLAAPETEAEVLRSGTWSTVRLARRLGRRVIIIAPDGNISEEGGALNAGH